MKQILFYAAEDDLTPVIREVEQSIELQYMLCGHHPTKKIERLTSGLAIPNLGKANLPTASICKSYLVGGKLSPIKARPLTLHDGSPRFSIDQMMNPDTIVFTPAGTWGPEMVLFGRVATIHETAVAQTLMNAFRKAIRAKFSKIKAFYVGPKAFALFRAGVRLAISDQTPREYDLAQ